MTVYDENSLPNETISTDGIHFKYNRPFFMICNKPLTRKLYFELTVNTYYPIAAFRNIPLYLGVSREASFGTLNADFCIGALYYEAGKGYDVQEKYNAHSTNTHVNIDSTYTHIPGATDIIGIGVDVPGNSITIYNNGEEFYSFSPTEFKLSDHTFYFCIYSDIYYDQITYDDRTTNEEQAEKFIKGYINFGKTGVTYLPKGYSSIFGYYYKRTLVEKYMPIKADITGEDYKSTSRFMDIRCTKVEGTFLDRTLRFISTSMNVNLRGLTFDMIADPNESNNTLYGSNVFLNLPVPVDKKIYFEFTSVRGTLDEDIIGIPITVGISNSNTSILSKSVRMCLYHHKQAYYQYRVIENFVQTIHQTGDMDTSIVPTQGALVGISLDLSNNGMTIYIDKVKFYTLHFPIDFSDYSKMAYLFYHDDNVFSGTSTTQVNLGQEPFDMDMPDDHISLYKYYSTQYKEILAKYIPIFCTVYNSNYKTAYVDIVSEIEDTTLVLDKPGFNALNYLFNNFETLTDIEPHYGKQEKDITFRTLSKIIKDNNKGYELGSPEGAFDINFGDDYKVKYNVAIVQTPNQTITVIEKTDGSIPVKHTESFSVEVSKYSKPVTLDVSIEADIGYDAGKIMPTKHFTLTKSTVISATPATLHRYTITIINIPKSKIYVEANGYGYVSSFTAIYGTIFKCKIIAETGYDPGRLNIEEGVVTSDITITTSSASTVKSFLIKIFQPLHYTVGIRYNGILYTDNFYAAYNSTLFLTVVQTETGYKLDHDIHHILKVKDEMSLSFDEAIPDLAKLKIDTAYHGYLTINGVEVNVQEIEYLKGTDITIDFKPSEGYFLESASIETK